MKKISMKKISALMFSAILLFCQTITVFAEENKEAPEAVTSLNDTIFERMEKVTENDKASLYIDKETSMIRLISKKTNAYVDTKVLSDGQGNPVSKNAQKSDLVFSYIDDIKNATIKTIDTYSMAVQLKQVEYENIENGIRITYKIGEQKLTIHDLPKNVGKEKMETLVISKLSKAEKKIFDEQYRLLGEKYVRTKDSGVSDLNINRLYKLLYETGSYTTEDLAADTAEFGIKVENALIEIESVIEYRLDGGDLVVTVPVKDIIYNEKFPIQAIKLLPYFMSSTSTEEGYMFVPDGSGAIINFNNQKISAINYSTRMYGEDILRDTYKYKSPVLNNTMPVFGMKWKDIAMVGIVENGQEIAEINSEISGKTDEYNKIGLDFTIRQIERVAAVDNPTILQAKHSKDIFNEDIVVRYKMLENEEANYTGMAKAYQKHLVDNQMLVKRETTEEAPLFLEVMGSIDNQNLFLGVPYKSNMSLTTFSQAQDMLSQLKASGVSNVKMQLNGWINNGISQTPVSKVKLEGVMGSKKAFTNLLDFAEKNGSTVFPNVALATATTDKNLNASSQLARSLDGSPAKILAPYPSTMMSVVDDYTKYVISPHYILDYTNKFSSQIKGFPIKNIASPDFGNTLAADYNTKKDIGRYAAQPKIKTALDSVSSKYNLMLSNPNDYAFANAQYITDLPTRSNRHKVIDYDVPFSQLVLDGYVEYSSTSLNLDVATDLNKQLMQCIETRTSPKFVVMNKDEDVLKNTIYTYLFSAKFSDWKDKIVTSYEQYNEFYKSVAGATMTSHEVVQDDVNRVTYSNGVVVSLNYTNKDVRVEGTVVPANSYTIS